MSRPITLLVEGDSDRVALETVAARLGVEFSEDLEVLVIGGAGNFGRAIAEAAGRGRRVGGLYDEAEERFVAQALNRQEGEDLTRQGFFACRRDLEEELVRAVGVTAATPVLEANGDLKGFRSFQDQDAHRDAEPDQQLRRYVQANGARKARYAALLGEAVEFDAVPEPLNGLVTWIWSA